MKGSGIENVLDAIASNTVSHMSGTAVCRDVRSHFIIDAA